MVVLGIDPGSTVTGYGVVGNARGRVRLVDAGCVRTRPDAPMADRLAHIHAGLCDAIARNRPDAVAIEAIFRHRSSHSALVLGQARGVALLAAGQAGLRPFEYNPATVKRSIGAHGRADKRGVARMVALLLGCEIPGPADVSDALAIAITHCQHARMQDAVARAAP